MEGKVLEKFNNFDKRFDRVDKKLVDFDNKFLVVNQRFDVVDHKFGEIDKRFDLIDKRFNTIDKKFLEHDDKFQDIYQKLIEHDDKFDVLISVINSIERRTTRMEKRMDEFLGYLDKYWHEMKNRDEEAIIMRYRIQRLEDKVGVS